MNNKQVAQYIIKSFNAMSHIVTIKARNGDKRAGVELMDILAAENIALKGVGYKINYDTGRLNKL